MLSSKAGKEVYVEPVIEDGSYRFTVKVGKPKDALATKKGTKLARDYLFALRWPEGFRCPRCGHERAWPVRGSGKPPSAARSKTHASRCFRMWTITRRRIRYRVHR